MAEKARAAQSGVAVATSDTSPAISNSAAPETEAPISKNFGKRKQQDKGFRPRGKIPRQDNPRFTGYNSKDKQAVNSMLSPSGYMAPIQNYFELQIQFKAFQELCEITYDTLKVREFRAVQHITRDQFVHSMKLVLFYRYYYYGYITGTFNEHQLIDDLLIPNYLQIKGTSVMNVIVDYIEAVGSVSNNFVNVKPYMYTLEEFFTRFNIFYVLDDQGNRTNEQCTFDNFNDQYSIGRYATNFVRVRTIMHCMRCVNMDEVEGSQEMLIKSENIQNTLHRSLCHFSQSETVGQRGVMYSFWDANQDREFGDILQFEDRFVGKQFFREDFLRQVIANSIVLNDRT